MPDWADLLWARTWWSYHPARDRWLAIPYHSFNLAEGAAWIVFGGLVLRRFAIHRRSAIEVAYALAFFSFGATDFREAYALQSWLIWLKVANLVILWRLRATVMGRFYPGSRLY